MWRDDVYCVAYLSLLGRVLKSGSDVFMVVFAVALDFYDL